MTIAADTSGPSVSITASTSASEVSGNLSIAVTRSGNVSGTATVNYATANGTALAGTDYSSMSGTLTFAANETSKAITVPILSDSIKESAETFTITLSGASSGTTIGDAVATITIAADGDLAVTKMKTVFFSGNPSFRSFFRLVNPNSTPMSVTATIRDSDGTALGIWTKEVLGYLGIQYEMAYVEAESTILPLTSLSGTAVVDFRVTAGGPGFVQHTVWNSSGGAFMNMSICDKPELSPPTNLTHVHDSYFTSNYPSTLWIQNAGSAAASVTLVVTESTRNQLIGNWTSPSIPAGGNKPYSIPFIENQLGFTPTDQYHLTFRVAAGTSGFSLAHTIQNMATGVLADMTQRCRLDIQ